jgi:DNA-directed RNA polymerase omega subunit
MKQAQDIISLPVELTPDITESKFRLVHAAAQRVRQLSTGEPALVVTRSIKDTTIALEETLSGEIRVVTGDEAAAAREEFKKRREQARIEEELSAKEEEIRKELSVYLSESLDEGGMAEVERPDTGEGEALDEAADEEEGAEEPEEGEAREETEE